MIIRGPEQSDQSAIEQLFAALFAAGNQHVLPPYLLTQQNPSQLTHTLYTTYAIKKGSSSLWLYSWPSSCLWISFIVGRHAWVATTFSCGTSLISEPWFRAHYVQSAP